MVLERSYWVAVGISSYIGLAGLQNSGLTPAAIVTLLAGPALLWETWRQTRRRAERAQLILEQVWAARVTAAAIVGFAQSRMAAGSGLLLEVVAALCLGTMSVAALYCLARIPRLPGLLDAPKNARSLDATAFVASLWAAVLVLAVARFIDAQNHWMLDPLTLDYTNTAASVGTLLVFTAAGWRVMAARKLELGVSDRANGALLLSLACLGVAIPTALVNVGPPDRVLPAAVVVACACLVWTSLTSDPSKIARALRSTLAILFLGAPLVLVLAGLAESNPAQSPILVLLAAVGATFVGLVGHVMARPLGPAQSRWLMAIEQATQDVLEPEPTSAIVATLSALKRAFPSPKAAPELWRINPPASLTVDVAGYLVERPAKVPAMVYELALQEPEHTLRRETLSALQIKRADVRGLLDWFEVRGAFSATAIVDNQDAIGFLLMPQEKRIASLTLEEAKALRALTERLSGVLSVTASLARSRQSELRALQDAQRAQTETARLKNVLQGSAHLHQTFARQLARPMLATAYSAAARNALAALEKWPPAPKPQIILCPVGVDPKPWAAAAHLSNRGGIGPLLLLDGAANASGETEAWAHPTLSPPALAHGGTLFIQDADLLSPEIQSALVVTLAQNGEASSTLTPENLMSPPPDEPVPACRIVLSFRQRGTSVTPPAVIPALNALFPSTAVRLPSLSERPEDVRAVVLDTLGRSVRGKSGQVLGVDRHAMQALLDYEWPGNEAQLRDVLDRAAMCCTGDQLRVTDLRSCGFDAALEVEILTNAISAPPAPGSDSDAGPPRRRRARAYRGRSKSS